MKRNGQSTTPTFTEICRSFEDLTKSTAVAEAAFIAAKEESEGAKIDDSNTDPAEIYDKMEAIANIKGIAIAAESDSFAWSDSEENDLAQLREEVALQYSEVKLTITRSEHSEADTLPSVQARRQAGTYLLRKQLLTVSERVFRAALQLGKVLKESNQIAAEISEKKSEVAAISQRMVDFQNPAKPNEKQIRMLTKEGELIRNFINGCSELSVDECERKAGELMASGVYKGELGYDAAIKRGRQIAEEIESLAEAQSANHPGTEEILKFVDRCKTERAPIEIQITQLEVEFNRAQMAVTAARSLMESTLAMATDQIEAIMEWDELF